MDACHLLSTTFSNQKSIESAPAKDAIYKTTNDNLTVHIFQKTN